MRILAAIVVGAVLVGTALGQSALPPDWACKGKLVAEGGWNVAGQPTVIGGALRADGVSVLRLRLGEIKRTMTCRIDGPDKKAMELTLVGGDAVLRGGGKEKTDTPLPDACIDLTLRVVGGELLLRDRYFVRPNPVGYKGKDRAAALAKWAQLPGASGHEIELRIECVGNEVGMWVDDRFAGRYELGSPANLKLTLSEKNAIGAVEIRALSPRRGAFVPVGLGGYRRPGAMAALEMPVVRGKTQVIEKIPFEIAGERQEIDVGQSRWLDEQAGPGGFVDQHYTRHAYDSRPEDIVLAIPGDDYSHAHVLCVVDSDPARTPVLTLRLTRFLGDGGDSGGRGDGIADSSIRIEKIGGQWPEGCRQVGTVKVKDGAGEKELPLMLAAIPMRSGNIQDVLDETGLVWSRSTQYLDLELTRELHPIRTSSYSNHSIKPVGKPSGVHVYGLTLERAAVKVRVRPRQAGHVFYPAERPGFDLEMTNRAAAQFAGTLCWRITDFHGKAREGRRDVALDAGTTRVAVDPGSPGPGWHSVELSLRDSQGRSIWEQATSLAVLAPNTRKAGAESPFGTWWFRQTHVGGKSLDDVGPLFKRMGFRHVCPNNAGPDAAELAKYGLSISMYPWSGGDPQQMLAKLDQMVARHPGRNWAMIFHENGIGETLRYAPEVLGRETPKLTEEQSEKLKKLVDRGTAYARLVRQKYPEMKLMVGNGGTPFAIELMRNGWPRDLVDGWGDETLGQAIMPEAPPGWFASSFWLDQYSKRLGYSAATTSCYEWRGRGTNPGNLTELEQAQIYTRDVLEGLIHRMPHINPGLIHDVGDSYIFSRWGSGGFCHRWPLLNPKISYVAMAVLTQELDGAKFSRMIDARSPTFFAAEFVRGDEFIYAMWLPRGERNVDLSFKDHAKPRWVDMNGGITEIATRDKTGRLVVSASPGYLTSTSPLIGVRADPTTCEPAPKNLAVADALADPGAWEIVAESDAQLEKCHFDFPRGKGTIAVKAVDDPEMKQATELTLAPQPELAWPVARYVVLKAKQPIALGGSPEGVGLWVKGNSCWGRVFFELVDARGETFYSIGAPCDGFSVGDWKCRTFINFDGWNFIGVPLPFKYASGFYGPPECEWNKKGGDGIVDYPVRVTRLVVEMRDRIAQVNRVVPVPDPSIRVSKLCGIGK